MPPKTNPLRLNPLQLRTLTLLQALAQLPEHGQPGAEPGTVRVANMPQPHGDHFHLGDAAVAARNATGLFNPAVWLALERKGLISSAAFPLEALLTVEGLRYDTGLGDSLLHHLNH